MANQKRKIEEVEQLISNLPKDIQDVTVALREIVFESSPKLTEEYKWSMPTYSYNGFVCYLQTAKRHVNLGFYKGNELQEKDTKKLLQGTGKTMRHIKVKKMDDIHPEAFISLIKEAMALNEE